MMPLAVRRRLNGILGLIRLIGIQCGATVACELRLAGVEQQPDAVVG